MTDPLNILIVDDDRVDRTVIRRQLSEGIAGVTIHEAATTAEAIDRLRATHIDCVLLDYRLPEQDGIDFYNDLKKTAGGPPAAVIMLTGQGSEMAAVEAMKCGVRDYLVKDQTTPSGLNASIEKALALVRAERALHLANEQFEKLALVDPVTGIGNRHHFDLRLAHALDRARRQSENIGLLMMDLNGFKTINDTHGHLMGDRVLTEIGSRLQNCARLSDTVARLGGDEFAVIMETGVTAAGIQQLAIRLEMIVAAPMTLEGKILTVGTSVGIAQFPEDGERPEDLLTAADEAMYQHKRETKASLDTHAALGE